MQLLEKFRSRNAWPGWIYAKWVRLCTKSRYCGAGAVNGLELERRMEDIYHHAL